MKKYSFEIYILANVIAGFFVFEYTDIPFWAILVGSFIILTIVTIVFPTVFPLDGKDGTIERKKVAEKSEKDIEEWTEKEFPEIAEELNEEAQEAENTIGLITEKQVDEITRKMRKFTKKDIAMLILGALLGALVLYGIDFIKDIFT